MTFESNLLNAGDYSIQRGQKWFVCSLESLLLEEKTGKKVTGKILHFR